MPRRFLALFFAVFFALTALMAGTVDVLDPYYHFHGPVLGMPLWLRYPRYQSPGAAKNLPYDHLLLGPLSQPTSIPTNLMKLWADGRRRSSFTARILRNCSAHWTSP